MYLCKLYILLKFINIISPLIVEQVSPPDRAGTMKEMTDHAANVVFIKEIFKGFTFKAYPGTLDFCYIIKVKILYFLFIVIIYISTYTI